MKERATAAPPKAMAHRLRRAFFPRYEGEERALHFRLITLVLRVWSIALAAWFVGRFLLYLTIGFNRGASPVFETFSILFSILALGLGYLLARSEEHTSELQSQS